MRWAPDQGSTLAMGRGPGINPCDRPLEGSGDHPLRSTTDRGPCIRSLLIRFPSDMFMSGVCAVLRVCAPTDLIRRGVRDCNGGGNLHKHQNIGSNPCSGRPVVYFDLIDDGTTAGDQPIVTGHSKGSRTQPRESGDWGLGIRARGKVWDHGPFP